MDAYKADAIWGKFKNIKESDFTAIDDVDADAPAFDLTADGITFNNADGKAITIYNAAGVVVEEIADYAPMP